MKILVVGAGLSGCSLARLLADRGHRVSLIEKRSEIGGLCVTHINEDGLKYEPYGPHIFHTHNDDVKRFVLRFSEFNGYIHRKGMIIDNRLFPFPLTWDAIDGFDEKELIQRELENRPAQIDPTNFETACLSIFGPALYRYFIKNYSEKMWGIPLTELSSEWAPKRLELREPGEDRLFCDEWQGLPVDGYSVFLERMIEGIPVRTNETRFCPEEFDVVAHTGSLDELFDYRYGLLPHRSAEFTYRRDEPWESDAYSVINLPQANRWLRKCNFKLEHNQESEHNWIQYQESVPAANNHMPMYSVNTVSADDCHGAYLKGVCKTNICPAGKLGLFKYLDMDEAVELSLALVPLIEQYPALSPEERHGRLKEIRGGEEPVRSVNLQFKT